LVNTGVDLAAVKQILPAKFKAKGLNQQGFSIQTMEDRRIEFEKDWERRLKVLVANNGLQFEDVWTRVVGFLVEINGESI